MRGAPLLPGLLVLLAACGGERAPRWQHLARAFDPAALEALGEPRAFTLPGGATGRLVPGDAGEGAWIELALPPESWKYRPGLDAWAAPAPIRGLGRRPGGVEPRLAGARTSHDHVDPRELQELEGEVPPGSFQFTGTGVFLRLAAGSGPPDEELVLSLWAGRGARDVGPGRAWRVAGRRLTGAGLPVWPGERVTLAAPVTRGSALRFAACLEPALVSAAEGALGPVVFRVSAGGRTLVEERVGDAGREACVWVEAPLPADLRGRVELTFSVEGPPAYTSFLAPVLGPAGPPARPSRPDLVLFVADTFRADNLAAYGSELGLTPNLDALAREGRVFARAWSTSTYTFPAHASMFAGLYPHRAGAVGTGRALPEPAVTIAEALAAAGYRTGAVTDGAMVSHRYGLDQGFELYDERLVDLDSTLARARAFLDADDGRPTFLFVHTYRVHTPFQVSPETRTAHGADLGLGSAEYAELERARLALNATEEDRATFTPEEERLVRELRALYLGGVADLDRALGPFLADLRACGLLEDGHVLFTSDHGEAFGEHGEVYHTGRVHEEQLRVPLILAGGGLAPGVVDEPASLLDVAPTLAALARIAPSPDWSGRPLVDPPSGRALYAFQAWGDPADSTLAVIEGGRKVIASEEPGAFSLLHAYDLAGDPAETEDLAAEAWARDLLGRRGAELETLLRPRWKLADAALDTEDVEELRALGYGE